MGLLRCCVANCSKNTRSTTTSSPWPNSPCAGCPLATSPVVPRVAHCLAMRTWPLYVPLRLTAGVASSLGTDIGARHVWQGDLASSRQWHHRASVLRSGLESSQGEDLASATQPAVELEISSTMSSVLLPSMAILSEEVPPAGASRTVAHPPAESRPWFTAANTAFEAAQRLEARLADDPVGAKGWPGSAPAWQRTTRLAFEAAEKKYRAAVSLAGHHPWSMAPRVMLGQMLMWDHSRGTESKSMLLSAVHIASGGAPFETVDPRSLPGTPPCAVV